MVLAGLAGTVTVGLTAHLVAGPAPRETLTPPQAHTASQTGAIMLVDIRRPDEWKRTGIAEGAIPIDMRRDDFTDAVLSARQTNSQPIALICARGVRSARMTARLVAAGLSPIIDIPEGMLGSFAGPGWLKRDLPVSAWNEHG